MLFYASIAAWLPINLLGSEGVQKVLEIKYIL